MTSMLLPAARALKNQRGYTERNSAKRIMAHRNLRLVYDQVRDDGIPPFVGGLYGSEPGGNAVYLSPKHSLWPTKQSMHYW
jgi:hypothetical protein